jgi:hypothetical protein
MNRMGKMILPALTISLMPMLSALAADSSEDPTLRCARMTDALERLVCYDRAAPAKAEAVKAAEAAKAEDAAKAAKVAEAMKAVEAAKAAEAAKVAEAANALEATKAAEAAKVAAALKAADAVKGSATAFVATPGTIADLTQTPITKKKEDESEAPPVVAQIANLREIRPFQYQVALDNGESWRQLEVVDQFWLRKGQTVRVRKYRSSYLLGTGDSGNTRWVRVEKVN